MIITEKDTSQPSKKRKHSEKIRRFRIREKHVMNSLLDMLVQEASYQMKNPGLRSTTADGKLHGIVLKNLLKLRHCLKATNFVNETQNTTCLSKQVGGYFFRIFVA